MTTELFHIFRNSPLGRETLLQSIFFCEKVGASLAVYIPKHKKILIQFEHNAVQVDLDGSYLASSDTAQKHAADLIEKREVTSKFIHSENGEVSIQPKIRPVFDFMTCPRSMSDPSLKIGLGHLGARVRRIVASAPFPVLITSPAYKPWNSIMVLLGGSVDAVRALKLGFRISKASGLPLEVFTQVEKVPIASYEKAIEDNNLTKEMRRRVNNWHIFEQGSFAENLYSVPHDALVVLGAYGHRPIKNIVFVSKTEKVQAILPNNLLIAGPKYREPNTSIPAWFPAL